LLLGVRSLTNVPASLEANWVFQITERPPRRQYFAGLKKAAFFEVLVPLFLLVFLFYSFLWGWRLALLHSFFGLAAAILLLEVLYFRSLKAPFACTFVPGKAKVHVYWFPYAAGFLLYASLLSSLERSLFTNPRYFLNYFVFCAILLAASRLYQNIVVYNRQPIVYHQEPEPVMVGLDYQP